MSESDVWICDRILCLNLWLNLVCLFTDPSENVWYCLFTDLSGLCDVTHYSCLHRNEAVNSAALWTIDTCYLKSSLTQEGCCNNAQFKWHYYTLMCAYSENLKLKEYCYLIHNENRYISTSIGFIIYRLTAELWNFLLSSPTIIFYAYGIDILYLISSCLNSLQNYQDDKICSN